jgi:hypothetical protein
MDSEVQRRLETWSAKIEGTKLGNTNSSTAHDLQQLQQKTFSDDGDYLGDPISGVLWNIFVNSEPCRPPIPWRVLRRDFRDSPEKLDILQRWKSEAGCLIETALHPAINLTPISLSGLELLYFASPEKGTFNFKGKLRICGNRRRASILQLLIAAQIAKSTRQSILGLVRTLPMYAVIRRDQRNAMLLHERVLMRVGWFVRNMNLPAEKAERLLEKCKHAATQTSLWIALCMKGEMRRREILADLNYTGEPDRHCSKNYYLPWSIFSVFSVIFISISIRLISLGIFIRRSQ